MLRFVLSAVLVGLYAVLMAKLVEFSFETFKLISNAIGFCVLIAIPLSSVFLVYIVKKYLIEADGGGISPVLAIAKSQDIENQKTLLTLKTVLAKLVITPLGTLIGATIGREGPTIQASSAIFYLINKTNDIIKEKYIALIGAGAGLSAAFNTPIGGIVYVIEELVKNEKDKKTYFLILLGVAIASITSVLLVGNNTYFGRVDRSLLDYNNKIFIFAILIGVVTAVICYVFVKIIELLTFGSSVIAIWHKNSPYKSAFIGGFFIALFGILSCGYSYGNGYAEVKALLSNSEDLPSWYFLTKMLGSIASQFASIPGGYFSTSLSIGAGIGVLFSDLFQEVSREQLYLLGMVSFLSALTGAPITSVVMVLQIAFTQVFALPLALAAFCSSVVFYMFEKESIYEKQAKSYL